MSYAHLTKRERFKIEAWLQAGHKQKEIAEFLGRDPSGISRELSKNGGALFYNARKAHYISLRRRKRGKAKTSKITSDLELQTYVLSGFKKYWSPEQIAGRGRTLEHPLVICHETIYQYVYKKAPELQKYLRQQKSRYRRRHGTKNRCRRREEAKKRRIDNRPKVVEKRSRIGDWEGDTVRGKEKTVAILTHVERRSGYLLADKLDHVTTKAVREKTKERFRYIPKKKKLTETLDNGIEFLEQDLLEEETGLCIYFAHPYHSWERGTNENTNGLLRQFFPKGTPFATITAAQVKRAEKLINHRPRKRLNYLTPYEVFKKGRLIALHARM